MILNLIKRSVYVPTLTDLLSYLLQTISEK